MIFFTRDGSITYANPAACRLLSYSLDDLQRSHLRVLLHPQDVPKALEEAFQQGKSSCTRGECRFRRSDGTVLWVEMSVFSFPPEYQGLMGWVLRDITARKKVEAGILNRMKLEAVSTMAEGIAHDFNNILSIILGNLDLVETKCRPEDPVLPLVCSANRAAVEAREVVFNFLYFARSAAQEVTTIHAPSLADEACRAALAGKPVVGQVASENGLWSLKGDPSLLRTALINILENARAASPIGGRIQVRLENVEVTPDHSLCSHIKPGTYVRFDIQDEGAGIPSDILDRVFDPYFSTKPRGTQKGMGMGLSVAWGIVQTHGGHIAVTSGENGGTTVTLYLPAVPESRPLVVPSPETEPPARAKILVMDDEPMLRQLAEAVIDHLGYRCEAARHGKEAITKYQEAMGKGEPFDMVILDLTVRGGMGGIPTMAQLLTFDPNVKAVIYTGYSADPILENYRLYGFQGALPKPYAIKNMADLIRRILGKKEH